MPTGALLLVLAAAFVHAGWNVLIAGAEDSQATTAVAAVIAAVVYAPIAVLTWDVDAGVVPYVVASSALELAYLALLAATSPALPPGGNPPRARVTTGPRVTSRLRTQPLRPFSQPVHRGARFGAVPYWPER